MFDTQAVSNTLLSKINKTHHILRQLKRALPRPHPQLRSHFESLQPVRAQSPPRFLQLRPVLDNRHQNAQLSARGRRGDRKRPRFDRLEQLKQGGQRERIARMGKVTQHLENGASGPVRVRVQLFLALVAGKLEQLFTLQFVGAGSRQDGEGTCPWNGGEVPVLGGEAA